MRNRIGIATLLVLPLALASCGRPPTHQQPEQGTAPSAPEIRIAQVGGATRAPTVTGVGTVVSRRAAAGTPGAVIGAEASSYVLRVPLSARDAARVTLGAAAQITLPAFNDDVVVGRVIAIAGRADAANQLVALELALPNDKRWQAGQTGNASIVASGTGTTILTVPPSAVFPPHAGDAHVYVVDLATSRIHVRKVTLAERSEADIRVTAGLKQGEWVALSHVDHLADGMKIAPVGPGR